MKVSIVGPIKENAKRGKTNPKIFVYQSSFEKIGYETKLFSTSVSRLKIFKLLKTIKESIIFGDTILLMLGGNASRKLIGIFVWFNKKYKKRLVLCPFGIGPINPLLKNKDSLFVNDFINEYKFGSINDKRVGNVLKKIDLVVVQNEILKGCFEKFYDIKNVFVLPNFRPDDNFARSNDHYLKSSIIYISRIVEEKGIFDLLDVVSSINKSGDYKTKIKLDVYGEKHLSDEKSLLFDSYLCNYIVYHGTVSNSEVQNIISKHAVSCLPTKYIGEGTPGFLIESLIAGVPPIVSSFSQVYSIVKDGFDSIVFEINNKNDLKNKILSIIFDDDKIKEMRNNSRISGQRYTLKSNVDLIKLMIEGE